MTGAPTQPEPSDPAVAGAPPSVQRDRFNLAEGDSLRRHTARGVVVNTGFQVFFAFLGLAQRVGIAAFLSTTEYGIWGLVLGTVLTLSWLKQVGISDRYVQQSDEDQELAFQRAFTIELVTSIGFFVVIAAALPIYAFVVYDRGEILLPGLVLATSLFTSAFHTPIWISYREMRFVRQRVLESINPVVALILTIALGIAGLGYWAPVIGTIVGFSATSAAAVLTCPYPIRLSLDRKTIREYFEFSWPVFVYSASGLVVAQGALIVGNWTVGLTGVAAIGLVAALTSFIDRVDGIISRTIYPAVCSVVDRRDLLLETFTKSNRLALMWSLPFGLALTLFATDILRYGFGERWLFASEFLSAIGLVVALGQIAFNWTVFVNATGETKPLATSALVTATTGTLVALPLMAWLGLDGFAIGLGFGVVTQFVLRSVYLKRILGSFSLIGHSARALAPTAVAVAGVLILRLVATANDDSLSAALIEAVVYVALTIPATIGFERSLLREILGYVRGDPRDAAPITSAAGPQTP